ncbi:MULTISPECIES: hypothetical protein [Actinosynnema]|uniref:hypothetical protein n=1 Tax=Actinosynnema TaxID=40566 RepID=UPI0020A428BB|nr:hypothetical protein [Actinosynnema pretiosum]MCP2098154.1 hypothetical protein [Actinosynnema pretiosum]
MQQATHALAAGEVAAERERGTARAGLAGVPRASRPAAPAETTTAHTRESVAGLPRESVAGRPRPLPRARLVDRCGPARGGDLSFAVPVGPGCRA